MHLLSLAHFKAFSLPCALFSSSTTLTGTLVVKYLCLSAGVDWLSGILGTVPVGRSLVGTGQRRSRPKMPGLTFCPSPPLFIGQLVPNSAIHQDRTVDLCEDYHHYIHFQDYLWVYIGAKPFY